MERPGSTAGIPPGAKLLLAAPLRSAPVERLLEREDEVAKLAEAVAAACAGRGSLTLIGGEAGIGKTSLVRALQDRVGGKVAFLSGACEPLSVPAPLGPHARRHRGHDPRARGTCSLAMASAAA